MLEDKFYKALLGGGKKKSICLTLKILDRKSTKTKKKKKRGKEPQGNKRRLHQIGPSSNDQDPCKNTFINILKYI